MGFIAIVFLALFLFSSFSLAQPQEPTVYNTAVTITTWDNVLNIPENACGSAELNAKVIAQEKEKVSNAIKTKYPYLENATVNKIEIAQCKYPDAPEIYVIYYVAMETQTPETQLTMFTVTQSGTDFEVVAGIPGSFPTQYDRVLQYFTDTEKQKLDFHLMQLIYGVEKENAPDKLVWVAIYPISLGGGYGYASGDAVVGGLETETLVQTSIPSTNGDAVVGTSISYPVPGTQGNSMECNVFKEKFSQLVRETSPTNHYYYSEENSPYCVGLIQTPISKIRALAKEWVPSIGYFGEKITFNARVLIPISYSEEAFIKLVQRVGQQNTAFTPAAVYVRLWEHISDNDALYLSIRSANDQPGNPATMEVSYYGMQADAHLDEINVRIAQRLQELGFDSTFKITPEMKRDPYFGSEPPTIVRENPTTYTEYYYSGTIQMPNNLFERIADWEKKDDPTQTNYSKNGNVVMRTKHSMQFHGGDLPNQNSYSIIVTPDYIIGIVQLDEADGTNALARVKSTLSPYMEVPSPESISFTPFGDGGVVYSAMTLEGGGRDTGTTGAGNTNIGNTPNSFSSTGTLEQFSGTASIPRDNIIGFPLVNDTTSDSINNIILIVGVMAVVGVVLWMVIRPH